MEVAMRVVEVVEVAMKAVREAMKVVEEVAEAEGMVQANVVCCLPGISQQPGYVRIVIKG